MKPKIDYLSNVEIEVYDESDNRDICELTKEIESFINKKKYMNPQEIKERFELTNHQFNQIRDKLKEKKMTTRFSDLDIIDQQSIEPHLISFL